MAQSRLPAAMQWLHSTVDAAIPAPTALVLLGGRPTGETRDLLFIGYDGDPEGERVAATSRRDWAGLGAKKRDEQLDIVCSACALVGTADYPTALARVDGLLTTVDGLLVTTPSMTQTPPFVAHVGNVDVYTDFTEAGLQARLVFHVLITTRI